MKGSFYVLIGLLLAGLNSQAVQVTSAKLDSSGENLIVDVSYGGGCKEHEFKLEVGMCLESYPVRCGVTVVDLQKGDFCEAYIHETVTFNLAAAGIKGSYFSGATLTFANSENVSVRLPSDMTITPEKANTIMCRTHMDSTLTISPKDNQITLVTKMGETKTYKIVGNQSIVLESNPPVLMTTYSMDDGRNIVTSFRDGEEQGPAYFTRLNGDASPEFQCRLIN